MTRPLTCREFTDFLADYLEDELPEGKATRFNTHLSSCPPCVSYVRTYREAIRLGRRAYAPEQQAHLDQMPEALVRAILVARSLGE